MYYRHYKIQIRSFFLQIITGIKNLVKWTPTVWRDRDFDHAFLEYMMHKKMVNMYNFFISEDAVTDWDTAQVQKALKALKICITILERRNNSFYLDLIHDKMSYKEAEIVYGIETRDEKILGALIGKYISWWWD
jgi:hypothetical protein